jgi:cold-inducible RNA-binding protein
MSANSVFVGNLPFQASKEDIQKLFEGYGTVVKVSLKKKSSGDPRGFGFVEMADDLQAEAAISALHDKDFMGRILSVTLKREAPPKPKKDYKEIKRKKIEAKLAVDKPLTFEEKLPEVKAVRPKHAKFSGRRGPKVWEKRKGTGKAQAWKKKPGGVKRKFRTEK